MKKYLILASLTILAFGLSDQKVDAQETTHSFAAFGQKTYIMGVDGKQSWTYPASTRDGYVLDDGTVILTLSRSKRHGGGAVVSKRNLVSRVRARNRLYVYSVRILTSESLFTARLRLRCVRARALHRPFEDANTSADNHNGVDRAIGSVERRLHATDKAVRVKPSLKKVHAPPGEGHNHSEDD